MTPFEQFTDIQIIDKVRGGDRALYELIIRRYNPYLYKIGRSYGYNHHDTEDLMQETFINAYMNLEKFNKRSALKTWVIRIMLNNCYREKEKYRTKNEQLTHSFHFQEANSLSNNNHLNTEEDIMNQELGKITEQAISEIPLLYRMVFSLREINGLNVAETAQVLDITQTNVKARLSRAKAMLRQQIEKRYSHKELYEFNLIYCDKIVDEVMKEIGCEP
ncbi:MAG: sigma-70 family RNA polymerase sigma factor [Balneolaceae bacterium]|nr:sigma-70 family RNA polymerase sigma factor [Balneolaceae bacterium]